MQYNQAFVYNLKSTFSFINVLLDVEFIKTNNTFLGFMISEYLPGLWSLLVNLLNYLIMDKLSTLS